jgi:hypothetical protein
VTAGSGFLGTWRCEAGHEWQTPVNARAGKGRGCAVCTNQRVLIGHNDLATTHPEIAAQAHGWDPRTEVAGSNHKRDWICPLGHIADQKISDKVKGHGCPICSGKRVLVGFNDLATIRPDLAREADGWDPSTVTAFSKKRRRWRCALGHTWEINVDVRHRHGCPVCAGRVVVAGFNDLASANPALAAEAYGWDPTTKTKYSPKKMKWKCSAGHIFTAAINNRTGGKGCPTCAKSGFDPNAAGYLYFLQHDEWEMLQVGITNYPTRRIHEHELLGWTALEVRGPMDGYLANDLETGILRALKKRGARFAHKAGGSRFDGWSEAWLRHSLDVASMRELLDFVYEDD